MGSENFPMNRFLIYLSTQKLEILLVINFSADGLNEIDLLVK